MNLSDEGTRINPQTRRSAQEFAEIQSILGVPNVKSFERLMSSKAAWITKTLDQIDTDWDGSFYPFYVGDFRRNFPQDSVREKLQNALKCSETYAKEGPNYVCRQPLICGVCASDNAHAFAQQKVKLLVAKVKQDDSTLRVLETVVHLGSCPPLELPEFILALTDMRNKLRRTFRDYQNDKFEMGRNEGFAKGLMSLDMFIHVAPDVKGDGDLFPHLHVVAIPYSNAYSMTVFAEFVCSRSSSLGLATMNITEKRYVIEKRRYVNDLSDFQKHMHYLARFTKNHQVGHEVKMHAVSSVPPRFNQRTSMAEADSAELPPRYKKTAIGKETLLLFHRESGKFQLL